MTETVQNKKEGDGSALQSVLDQKAEKIPYEIVEEEKLPGSRIRFKAKLTEDAIAGRLKETLKEMGRQVRIPGFRPGKAPQSLVRKSYEPYAREETVKRLVPRLAELYSEDKGIESLGQPYLLDWKSNKDDGTTVELALEVHPDLEITDELLEGLTVEAHRIPVDESYIERSLKNLQIENATYEPTEEGYQPGDGLLFSCTVRNENGEKIEERSVNEYYSTKVEDEVPEEVAKELAGKKKGEELTMDLEEESEVDPSKKEKVHYEATVHEVKHRVLPELDDEFAKDVNEDFETLDDLKKSLRENAEKQEEQRQREEALQEVYRELGERLDFDLPRALVEQTANRSISDMEQRLNQYGMSLRTMDQSVVRNYAQSMQEQAKANVKNYLIVRGIAKHLNVEPTEEDINAELERIASQTGRKPLAVRAQLEARKQWDQFVEDLSLKLTNDKILEKANVQYEEISAEEYEKLQQQKQEEQAAKLRGEQLAAEGAAAAEATEEAVEEEGGGESEKKP